MMTIVVVVFFVLIFNITSGRILLYNTENDYTVEKFDCVHHVYNNGEQIPYCQRLNGNNILTRTNSICENDGEKRSFHDLLHEEIEPSEVLKWNSSVEMADLYAHIYYNRSAFTEHDNHFICRCTQLGTFGKYCEYQLTHDTELFSDAIEAQFEQKRKGDSWNTQRYGNILCYKTLECNSGLMCLDWRDINDGTQQCVNGIDEENWDKLEFNECEDNEFRCTNGMCIPEEFWLDGHVDCMDWSDEIHEQSGESCSFTPNAMECDEHICPRNSFSCGDGQCVDWITRMAFQRLEPAKNDCFNKRNLNHMCEVSPHRRAWTLPNGLCWPDDGYKFESSEITNRSQLEECQYLLRCSLSDGFEFDCPCDSTNCSQIMKNLCPGTYFVYPLAGLINPNVLLYYTYNASNKGLTFSHIVFHGSLRCRGYELTLKQPMMVRLSLGLIRNSRFNSMLCTLTKDEMTDINYLSIFQYDKFCYNDSLTFNGRPYAVNPNICNGAGECISQYRIHDGFLDCLDYADESSNLDKNYCTGKVGQHRFQCYNDKNKCFSLANLGDGISQCSNNYDEMWYDGGLFLRESIKCQKNDTADCDRLKAYIRWSSMKNENLFNHSQEQISTKQMPFRSYCDSFWDLQGHSDEFTYMCQNWVCQSHQYQCRSGQCIDLDWVCDGEWDCSDASDEEAIFLIDHWSTHNARLLNLNSRLSKCRERYTKAPFSNTCNTSSEFGCYLSSVSDPLNIQTNRPCINLTQLGDGRVDCYNAYDERNTFEANVNSNKMLGFHLRCGNHSEPYTSACLPETKNNCTTILCSNHRNEDEACSGIRDAVCLLDGRCVKNGRCDGEWDCLYGEDEYWCPSNFLSSEHEYRSNKKNYHRQNHHYLISEFPPKRIPANGQNQLSTPNVNPRVEYPFTMHSYQCNHGVAVIRKNETICLCPPAYYGRRCEYFSDRISIIAQIDQKILLKNALKIKAKLLFYDQIIDTHEFTIIPTIESLKEMKHKFYLIYSRSARMLEHKRERYFNRTDVINNHPYSVHFDAFSLENHHSVKEIGSWHYPIYFDYLPAYRLAVVLKFPSWFSNNTSNSCLQNTCNQNSLCMPVFNQMNSYYCTCKNGYYGKNCEQYDQRCETYCSRYALCRNGDSELQVNKNQPSCICPLNKFGPRCNLQFNDCNSNPCLNNGTCFPINDQSGETPYVCLCSKRFYGNRCEHELRSVHVNLIMPNTSSTRAAVIQLYDIETPSFQLAIRHQQVYHTIPTKINYFYSNIHAPSLGLLKIYENLISPQYYIMYSSLLVSTINITSSPQHCPHVSSLLSTDTNQTTSSVFVYHHICRNDTQRLCFYDDNYLCVCQSDHYRAECFGHDTQIDHCNYCLSNGKCIRGDLKDPNDFICICPPSYYGRRCEYNLETSSSVTNISFHNNTTSGYGSNASQLPSHIWYFVLFIIGFFA